MYKALYRKYRPMTFDDMVGQEHIRSVLKRQCETGRISHAYIFCGTRGTGKTTSAKILAKAVNCLSPENGEPCGKCVSCLSIDNGSATDVLELDAASNNSVDDIRQLCDELIYPPAFLKKRVYIIDEVHMLSSSAYNALLKTLEEPPEHVLFILATTELNKIPPTILSRCQRFEFRRISASDISGRLLYVSGKENLKLTDEGASLIARLADGSMRDGFSLLESCVEAANGGKIDREVVSRQLGIAENNTICDLFEASANRNVPVCLSLLDDYYNSAKSLSVLLDDMLSAVRDMLYVKQGGNPDSLMSNMGKDGLIRLSGLFSDETLIYFASVAEETRNRLTGYAMNKRLITELALIRMCDARFSDTPEALAARISALEKKLALVRDTDKPATVGTPSEAPEEEPGIGSINKTTQIAHEAVSAGAEGTPYDMKSELLEQLSSLPAVCKLLSKCEVISSGNRLYIIAGDDFTRDMMKSNADAIKNAAKLADGRNREITVTDKKPEINENASHIDEII